MNIMNHYSPKELQVAKGFYGTRNLDALIFQLHFNAGAKDILLTKAE